MLVRQASARPVLREAFGKADRFMIRYVAGKLCAPPDWPRGTVFTWYMARKLPETRHQMVHFVVAEGYRNQLNNLKMTHREGTGETASLPESFPVNVLMECRPGVTRWLSQVWRAVGVTVGSSADRSDQANNDITVAVDQGDYRQWIYPGFEVCLHIDEAEDYYHNLMSPAPGCYVVADMDEDSPEPVPVPFLVTLSADEAHAYGEGGSEVFHVPLPAELYVWVERFVLAHYVPEKKVKRKLKSAREERGYPRQS